MCGNTCSRLLLFKYTFHTSAGDFSPGLVKMPFGYRIGGAAAWQFDPDGSGSPKPAVNIISNGPTGTITGDKKALDVLFFNGTVDQDGTFTLFVPLVPYESIEFSY